MRIIDLGGAPLIVPVALFLIAAAVIAVAGSTLVRFADRIADETGLGEAFVGGIFLGATTSIPDLITSTVAAFEGYAGLAVSNAVGGVAAQTSFLAVADLVYRRANLEHAAASLENLVQAALLMTLLAIPILAFASPDVTLWGLHPATPAMAAAYVLGIHVVRQVQSQPLWTARLTVETRRDVPAPDAARGPGLFVLWRRFGILAILVAAAGFVLVEAAITIADRTGLSETVVGAYLTAVATSLAELVTSVAAVRQGALTLAVASVIGGNTFDLMLVPVSDIAFRGGSVYHAVGIQDLFVFGLTIVLTGILLIGLLRRERVGVARMGLESFLVLVLYLAAFVLLIVQSG